MSLPASSAPLLPDFPATLPASMDFAALLAEGVALTQAMSSDQWSDYNEHDPGLTMLEQQRVSRIAAQKEGEPPPTWGDIRAELQREHRRKLLLWLRDQFMAGTDMADLQLRLGA